MKRQERVIYNEFPYKIYTYDNKTFYLEKIGAIKSDCFSNLDNAIESLKYQTT